MNLLCCLVLMLGASVGTSQEARGQDAAPEFEVDAVCMRIDATSPKTRLDLYTRIPYNNLNFINTASGFKATYEVNVAIHKLDSRNRRDGLVMTRLWENEAVVNAFFQTQSEKTFDHSTNSVELSPGRYLLEFQLTDKDTQQAFVREMPVEVRDLRGAVALSDLILLEDYDEKTKTIFPRISDRIGSDLFTFKMFYEVYVDQPQSVHITREIVPLRKRSSGLIRAGRTLLGLEQEEEPVTSVYSTAEIVSFKRGRHQTVSELPLEELKMGDYLVRVRLQTENGRLLAQTERTFSAQWTGLADHISNLDEAIDQLRYIAKERDLAQIRQATTADEQLKRFKAFWDKFDPTPGTLRNERMEEYYYRIDSANRKYGSSIPGWKTDRGQVLISFGEPDDIERHNYNYNVEPYQIWWYNRIGRKFIFIDKTGFGDFELLVPVWDASTRIR